MQERGQTSPASPRILIQRIQEISLAQETAPLSTALGLTEAVLVNDGPETFLDQSPRLPQVWKMPHDLVPTLHLDNGNQSGSRKGLQNVGYVRFVFFVSLPSPSTKLSPGMILKIFSNPSYETLQPNWPPNINPLIARYGDGVSKKSWGGGPGIQVPIY